MLPCVTMSDDKRAIEEARQEMAKVDAQLLGLLDRRAKLARGIGKLRGEGAPQLPAESRAQLAALVARATGDMPADSIRDIFREIHAASNALELGVVVAFVGTIGSSGYGAARKRFGGPTKLLPFDSAEEAVREVVAQRASFAVLPLETKTDGLVQHTLTALIASELKLVATFEAVPSVHLVNRTGNLADVEKVYAAPFERQACKAFFAANPRLQVLEVKTPELACQLAHEDHGSAALADELYAATHELTVCQRDVADAREERIRYAVLGARPSGRTGADSTCLVFSVSDSPGALLEVLKQFAERGINLTKIQSRPTPGEAWGYLFFVELAGHATDRAIVAALEEVKRQTRFFKLLGSYAAGT